jgi:hypothetical protein
MTPREKILREGLERIASWSEGMVVTGSFDEPGSAKGAKRSPKALGTEPLNVVIGGRPNPRWAEWFMGWASGWTRLEPLEMAKFREWSLTHGTPSAADDDLPHLSPPAD